MRPFKNNTGASKLWGYSGKPQRPNPEAAIAQLAHPAGDPVGTCGPGLNQTRHDDSIRPAQAEHCNTLSTSPLLRSIELLGGNRLAKYFECLAAGHLDGANNLTDHVDPVRPQGTVPILGGNPHHLADLEIGDRTRLPINLYWHVRRIGHTQAVDDDAAEATDCAHDTRAADAAITIRVGWNHSGAADAAVLQTLAPRYLHRDKEQRQRGHPASGGLCNRGGALPHVVDSSSLRSLGL
jgi:hypothetical protein